MKPLEQSIEAINALRADLDALDPRAVHSEVIYMRGYRLKAWSANEAPGAGSDEPPMLLPDKLDRWLIATERKYHAAIAAGQIAKALQHQDQILARLTLTAAKEIVAMETASVACAHCGAGIDQAKGQRLLKGRCYACYEYARRHDGQDPPQTVLDARIEAQAAAEAAAKVPGARSRSAGARR